MRYSLEFKLKCIELYRKGIWMETPNGVFDDDFRHRIREWHLKELEHGIDGIKTKHRYKKWTADEKLVVVIDYRKIKREAKGKTCESKAVEG